MGCNSDPCAKSHLLIVVCRLDTSDPMGHAGSDCVLLDMAAVVTNGTGDGAPVLGLLDMG